MDSKNLIPTLIVPNLLTLHCGNRQAIWRKNGLADDCRSMTPNSPNHFDTDPNNTKVSRNTAICRTDRIGQQVRQSLKPVSLSQDTTSPSRAKHWRVQFLRHSAQASTARGISGLTPPYCPSGPTLSREISDEIEESALPARTRNRSPLRNFDVANHLSSNISIKYASETSALSTIRGMPHAVSMPHSGFQALILCGPGIGLSSFTSVPAEYPKALINIANRPMVWYVLDWCYRMGVTDITLITPPAAKAALSAALAQNPYLTSLPSPSADLLAPEALEFTTPTAELLRLPEIQKVIQSDFLLLPCDLICDISGDSFLETYLATLGGLGGVGLSSGPGRNLNASTSSFNLGGGGSGRRGGLSIWYNTVNREESVKGEECDFMATSKLDPENDAPLSRPPELCKATLRKLVSTMPMSELWDTVGDDKSWRIRQSLLRRYGSVKCLTKFRDSHIYFFPYWIKEYAATNEDFESVSEDLVGTWAKSEWRKTKYRTDYGAQKIFSSDKPKTDESQQHNERPIEDEVNLLSLSSTHVTEHQPRATQLSKSTVQLASRVQISSNTKMLVNSADNDDDDQNDSSSLSLSLVPLFPPMLSYILASDPTAPLVRRVDTTPLLLSVSLLLAKIPSIEEAAATLSTNRNTTIKPISSFAHASKIAATTTIAPRVTISRSDTLIDNNTTISTQCVIKTCCIGSAVHIGVGARITGCVIMDGASIGEKCVLTNTVIGKKAKIGKNCVLQTCEVQDGNVVGDGTEGKSEKYLIGGLEDEVSSDEYDDGGTTTVETTKRVSVSGFPKVVEEDVDLLD